jgi:hypothetical protein
MLKTLEHFVEKSSKEAQLVISDTGFNRPGRESFTSYVIVPSFVFFNCTRVGLFRYPPEAGLLC